MGIDTSETRAVHRAPKREESMIEVEPGLNVVKIVLNFAVL
jgi:hypothetical protein